MLIASLIFCVENGKPQIMKSYKLFYWELYFQSHWELALWDPPYANHQIHNGGQISFCDR